MNKTDELQIVDKDHIWYNGKQYISLQRLNEIENRQLQETKLLTEKVEKLTEENKSFECLLKSRLEEDKHE